MQPLRKQVDSTSHAESRFAAAVITAAQAAAQIDLHSLLEQLALSWKRLTQSDAIVFSTVADATRETICVTIDDEQVAFCSGAHVEKSELFEFLQTKLQICSNRQACEADLLQLRRPPVGASGEDVLLGGLLLSAPSRPPQDFEDAFLQLTTALLSRALDHDRVMRDAKLESLAEFAAGAGHEINNPLATISGRAQLLLRKESDPHRRRSLSTIGSQALRVRDMLGDVMLFARPPLPHPARIHLKSVLKAVIERFSDEIVPQQLTITCDCDEELEVWADENQLCVVISELLRNAIEASPQSATILMTARRNQRSSQLAELTVRDEGPGLTPEAADHLFDPFYSGRPAGRGLGFGLSKCWRIVTNHGGRIEVPRGHQGFEIKVFWPTDEG